MTLSDKQRELVEQNLGLVGKVIKDKVHFSPAMPISYDDLFQTGCLGLCKAAVTNKGGCFSTYAYLLIWREICSSLRRTYRGQLRELPLDSLEGFAQPGDFTNLDARLDASAALANICTPSQISLQKGLRILLLMSDGYSSTEAGAFFHLEANSARALASKARRHIKTSPEISQLLSGGI